ncbi:2-dehydropantoate 2-reductase N-terminal domain-containing protein [Limosilactobacillus mucosae]
MVAQNLSKYTIAVLGAGAVGRSVAADCKLAGNHVRLFDLPEFAKTSLKDIDKTGIEIQGFEYNRYSFKRSGIAKFDLVSDDLKEVVAGAQIILVAVPSVGHNAFFEQLVPLLEDGQIIHIIPDNFGSLRLRKQLREKRPELNVIIGVRGLLKKPALTLNGYSSATEQSLCGERLCLRLIKKNSWKVRSTSAILIRLHLEMVRLAARRCSILALATLIRPCTALARSWALP